VAAPEHDKSMLKRAVVNGNDALTPADLREIDTDVSEIKVHGGRMNEEQMKVVDQTV
jgi:hypothetical protein